MNRFFQALVSRFLHDYLQDYHIQDQHTLKICSLMTLIATRMAKRRRYKNPTSLLCGAEKLSQCWMQSIENFGKSPYLGKCFTKSRCMLSRKKISVEKRSFFTRR